MRDLKMTDVPTYLWETLDVYQDNSYCYNIRPGQHVVGDLFDSSRTKLVSYNRKSHVQIICVCDPYKPPFYARECMYGVYSAWKEIGEDIFNLELMGYSTKQQFPPLCTSHHYF